MSQERKEELVVLTATEKATKGLVSAVSGVEKIIDTLPTFQAAVEEINEQIAIKSNKLTDLEKAVESQARENKIELSLKIRENEDEVLDTILEDRGLVTIEPSELSNLEDAATSNEETVKDAVKKAEAIITSSLTSKHEAASEKAELEFQVKEADNRAKIERLTEQVKFLEEQLKSSEDRATAKLEAEIKIAEAGSGVTINTASGK